MVWMVLGLMLLMGACGVAIGYLSGRREERRDWLRWLKTVKVGTAEARCLQRFHEKNGAFP